MKNNLTQYLEETYKNSASRACLKIILKAKTDEEYIENIQKRINKTIREIIEFKQSICVMDQFVTFLEFNEEAKMLEGYDKTSDFYMTESNKLCNEVKLKVQHLHDLVDILAIAKANKDMNYNLIDSEREIIKKYGEEQ